MEFVSEFDVAAFVIYVGDAYTTVHRKKQWVFVADGSTSDSHSGELLDSLLAISFSAPLCESDLCTPVNPSLAGSMVSGLVDFGPIGFIVDSHSFILY